MDAKEIKPLIADKFTNPIMLLLAIVLPQAVLVFINLSFWSLVSGEMSAEQQRMALGIFVFELSIIAVCVFAFTVLKLLKRKLNLIFCGLLFFAHIGYLWLVTALLDNLLPDSVTVWILPPDQVIYYQFVLMMPAVFYTGLRLSCFNMPLSKGKDISITVAILVMVPLCSYIFTTVFFRLFRGLDIPSVIMTIMFISGTAITLMAFLRVLTYIYVWLNNNKYGYFVLLSLVGLVGPLAGLLLNRGIPFPCDFQSLFVYLLAIANGVILLCNFKGGTKAETFGWFLRCLMYPFSLYFFLVFLPFMPLGLIAIIAAGGGFLILAPTALFIVHSRKLADEGMRVAGKLGVARALLLFVTGFAVMPVFIVTEAVLDRGRLMQAVDYVYSPDYANAKVEINPESVKRSLLKLRDMKDGIFLPFISSFYNEIVFDGMILPDHKMNEMYLMFFGERMAEGDRFERFGFGMGMGRGRGFGNRGVVMPERNVELSDVSISYSQQEGFVRANIQLKLSNLGSDQSEFVTYIEADRGVLVSGYWLKVGEEKVAGSVFEKKAAMWIYHMIRDMTRRDPGLLIYKNDDLLKLSVYPFGWGEKRVTGIELLYPAGKNLTVTIGGREFELDGGSGNGSEIMLTRGDQRNVTAIIPPQGIISLPTTMRKPYLHFIVDRSIQAEDEFASFAEMIGKVADEYGRVNGCRITLANYETFDVTDGFIECEEVRNVMQSDFLEGPGFKGAFCYTKAIKQKLLEFKASPPTSPTGKPMVPIFVVIQGQFSRTVSVGDMSAFKEITADVDRFYIAQSVGGFTSKEFNGQEYFNTKIKVPGVALVVKYGDSVAACINDSGWGLACLEGNEGSELEVYDDESERFVPITDVKELDSDTVYAKGLAVWDKYRETVYSPYTITGELAEIVKMSKDCGVMVPSTSYIVLENSAQLEMLKRKEKQGLSANQALEFDEFLESPAPPVIFLIPFALVLLFKLRKRKLC